MIERFFDGDVVVYQPKLFEDDRGIFFESYNLERFNDIIGKNIIFLQDNHSRSAKGVMRGIHYQRPPFEQAKLVRVVAGSVIDLAVDLRIASPTFGQHVMVELSEANKKQIWIPEGFGHAFLSLEDNTEVLYKTNNYYSVHHEVSLSFLDKELQINWPQEVTNFSEKDGLGLTLSEFRLLMAREDQQKV